MVYRGTTRTSQLTLALTLDIADGNEEHAAKRK